MKVFKRFIGTSINPTKMSANNTLFRSIGVINIPNIAIKFDAIIEKVIVNRRYLEGSVFIKNPLSLMEIMLTGMLNTIAKKESVFVCCVSRCNISFPTKRIKNNIHTTQNKPNIKEARVNFLIFHFSGFLEYITLSVAKDMVIKSLKKNRESTIL